MRNRKFVKLKVDMYSDTKFKIIDTMEERDLIHYIWARLITLCGHVNLGGDLYMSKTIPYTAETLALEFNRSVDKVKLALKVFIDLEMLEISKDNVYRISNFAKHQNIKVEEIVDKEINKKVYEEKEYKNRYEEGLSRIVESDLPINEIGEESSNEKLEIDSKNKVIKFEDKCGDLISLDENSNFNVNRNKRRRINKKNNKIEDISSDRSEDDGDNIWNYGDVVKGEVIEKFTF